VSNFTVVQFWTVYIKRGHFVFLKPETPAIVRVMKFH
jgi:hypothetical protein